MMIGDKKLEEKDPVMSEIPSQRRPCPAQLSSHFFVPSLVHILANTHELTQRPQEEGVDLPLHLVALRTALAHLLLRHPERRYQAHNAPAQRGMQVEQRRVLASTGAELGTCKAGTVAGRRHAVAHLPEP